jgi:pyruvate,water dikinase
MGGYVLDLREIDHSQVAIVGGKAALLGELSQVEGIHVPAGFCVTTSAFVRVLAEAPSIGELLDRLSRLNADEHDAIRALSGEVRRILEGVAVPEDVAAAITSSLARMSERAAYAVRSSATAEDLPTASFAGQHDTYLNIVGPAAILEHVSWCWASLFSERATTYRLHNGIDHRKVQMAVVVQKMVLPRAAGVLFTADPVTSNRKVGSIEAGLGLGDDLVSGLMKPDVYRVRDGEITAKAIAPDRRDQPALTDSEVVRLDALGRRIEAHFGRPQDIEWCLDDDGFRIVQSRPITTLFPIPAAGDQENHVYISVGHQQMMTDAMKALGISVWQLTALVPMHEAGGRLFVDATPRLATPASRTALLELIGRSDPLIGDALQTIIDRGDFIPVSSDGASGAGPARPPSAQIETDPALVTGLIERAEASIAALKRAIQARSGPSLLEFILADIQELKRLLLDPESIQVIMAGMEATWWLNDKLQAWLGEKNPADTLTQSVPYNVTSEMGLALLEVADAIRPHPEVVAFLEGVEDDGFLGRLEDLPGGVQARGAIEAFLEAYGMRCAGEIDITRPRWSERPTTLVPVILTNVRSFEPGAGRRLFEQGRREAQEKEHEVLERLRALPDGARKADETKRMIDRVRTFSGFREYPKYGIVSRYFIYKQALLAEAQRLVDTHVLQEPHDIFHLTFQELQDVVRTHQVDHDLISRRREEFISYQALTPPRVLTSDGEAVAGRYRRDDVPAGALIGLAVSTGAVEGRARVILEMAQADLEPGDILVTAYTDPSWTPLFVAIAGLVTEVGGLMTHGAVIAREYGLPAVVGVQRATELIRDGQLIRVDATNGYVEILS